jgi:hypothetical protein
MPGPARTQQSYPQQSDRFIVRTNRDGGLVIARGRLAAPCKLQFVSAGFVRPLNLSLCRCGTNVGGVKGTTLNLALCRRFHLDSPRSGSAEPPRWILDPVEGILDVDLNVSDVQEEGAGRSVRPLVIFSGQAVIPAPGRTPCLRLVDPPTPGWCRSHSPMSWPEDWSSFARLCRLPTRRGCAHPARW